MKKQDIGILAVVAIVSGVISIIVSGFVFSTSSDRSQKVEVVEAIGGEFVQPSPVYFNQQSVNPAQNIDIGTDQNSNPFGSQ